MFVVNLYRLPLEHVRSIVLYLSTLSGGFDEVRFSAYRTAMKLRHLQKSLHCELDDFIR